MNDSKRSVNEMKNVRRENETKGGCSSPDCGCAVDRRNFIRTIGMGSALLASASQRVARAAESEEVKSAGDELLQRFDQSEWPVLKRYPQSHLAHIALPLGGIGTGTVSLGGRGDLRDWEIMNRSAKGFVPTKGDTSPFFALFLETADGGKKARALEGPIDRFEYEGSHGCVVPNDGLPRFEYSVFATAYPLGQVLLSDPDLPVEVCLQAFNPLVPGDAETSGIPVAILRYRVTNKTAQAAHASICGTMPNFIGMDGWETARGWSGDLTYTGAKGNRNQFRESEAVRGIFMDSTGIDAKQEAWGTMALCTTAKDNITYRTAWESAGWGASLLNFWDDFSADGRLEPHEYPGDDMPLASLAVGVDLPPNGSQEVTFLLAWHFPNRRTWTPQGGDHAEEDRIGNYYTTRYSDAWDVAEKTAPRLDSFERDTLTFVRAFCESSLPGEVKEAALFNISTLRTQTGFRTPDGLFFGFEGLCNHQGCCHGSCTHVWNYEQATAFLFGELAMHMRDVEFAYATDEHGLMSFRVHLPLSRAHDFGKAAADGQMGCLMKMYRDWQLSGDDEALKRLWPKVRKALEFCWISGGWDANCDGVMEGCQHNTMDVEYYGPNPQMGLWYLGALRAVEAMARHLGETDFAAICQRLYENGRAWIDANLFNGEYYIHEIRPPKDVSEIAPSLLVGMGSKDITHPEYQLGEGCLVDQLVGQYMAHVCGLGYLVDPDHVKTTLRSIKKYNQRDSLNDHFNCMRSFALGDEAALLMASYPKERPENPFPYFTEVMTGFEYTAAVGMLYEGMIPEGLECIRNIRERYDGLKRNPFNEAECGHHYARAMASWAAVLAFSGFQFSAVDKTMAFAAREGNYFWSNGYAWGRCVLSKKEGSFHADLQVLHGELALLKFTLSDFGKREFDSVQRIAQGSAMQVTVLEG